MLKPEITLIIEILQIPYNIRIIFNNIREITWDTHIILDVSLLTICNSTMYLYHFDN